MSLPQKHLLSLSLFLCMGLHAAAQADSRAIADDTTYTLIGNALLINQDLKIVVGQPIIIGKASGENGWYQTITFRNPTAWPLLLNREAELNQNVEYQSDESIRERDKIKSILSRGDTVTVTKLKRFGKKRPGKEWFVIWMRAGEGPLSLHFRCYIIDAIQLGEVIIPRQSKPY